MQDLEAPPIGGEPEPIPEPVEDPGDLAHLRREFYIVNRTIDVRKRARELTEEEIRHQQREAGPSERKWYKPWTWSERVSSFLQRKKFHVFEEYYRQKWTESTVEAMNNNNNSFLSMDFVRGIAADATHESDKYFESGQAKIGELKTEVEERGADRAGVVEAEDELKRLLLDEIIRPVVNGTITNEEDIQKRLAEFMEAHGDEDVVRRLFGIEANQYGEAAKLFATDLLEMGSIVRADIAAHRYSLDQLDQKISIKLSNAQWARQTEINETLADKMAAFGRKNKYTAPFWTPAFLGAATAIGTTAVLRIPRTTLRAMMAAPLAGSLVGAGYGALRRWREVKIDRAMHMGERAYGMVSPDTAKRRKEMDTLTYDMAQAADLLDGGNRDEVRGKDREGLQAMLDRLSTNPTNDELRQDILSRVAEIRTRLDKSTGDKIDLISFSSRETVEQERFELVRNIAAAKVALRRAGMSDADVTRITGDFESQWLDRLISDKASKDRAYKWFQLKQTSIAAGEGAITGLVSGIVLQELGELGVMRHIRASTLTALEHTPGVREVLEKLSELGGPFENLPPTGFTREELVAQLKAGGVLDLGEVNGIEYEAVIDPGTGAIELWDADTHLPLAGDLPDIVLDADGNLSIFGELDPDIQEALENAGFDIHQIDTSDLTKFPPLKEVILEDRDSYVFNATGQNVHIPEGTTLIPDPVDPAKWDLVLQSDPTHVLVEDLSFDPQTGEIVPGWTYGPGMDDTTINITEGGTHIATKDDALAFWDKAHTEIDRREWYAYDQAGSQNNELRAYTIKRGNTLILDMSKMAVGWQKGLSPNPIDVQQVISGGQAGFAFSLPGMTDKPIWIPDSADGVADGLLHLDPSSTAEIELSDGTRTTLGEVSRMLVDQDALNQYADGNIGTEYYGRREVFRLGVDGKRGFWEPSWYTEQDGEKVLKVFATGMGTGELGGGQIGTEPLIDLCGDITKDIPQIIHEAVPGGEPIPIIPIPMIRRKPLEEMEPGTRREPPEEEVPTPYTQYETGYGQIGDEQRREEYSEVRSRLHVHIDNTPLLLDTEKDDAKRKINDYLSSRELREISAQEAERFFNNLWSFLESNADFDALERDDGTLSNTVKAQLEPIIAPITADDTERNRYVQALGKFIAVNPGYAAYATSGDERKLKALVAAYRSVRSILSPI
ncbi:hypothetical protein A3H80_01510 [Candidatus Roizmanbacteria bacterium RIFCSPLOWO2_02_FULL_37_19]|nr:MAG: hypothetical protein A3E10_02230 [Candidatus Roizmanbacteria bacterium RIFCSPHIGHO2_12_FULL_37_23]OGK53867.1 MAG: hypothetical protein A3H80_01510 [Candidatus Roizmanbacteria bacterium RIFCSPLOWO2_02_FULL_37_19]